MTSFPSLQQSRQFDGNLEKHLENSFSGVRMLRLPIDQSSAPEKDLSGMLN